MIAMWLRHSCETNLLSLFFSKNSFAPPHCIYDVQRYIIKTHANINICILNYYIPKYFMIFDYP